MGPLGWREVLRNRMSLVYNSLWPSSDMRRWVFWEAQRSVSDLLARKSVECLFLCKLKGKKGPSGTSMASRIEGWRATPWFLLYWGPLCPHCSWCWHEAVLANSWPQAAQSQTMAYLLISNTAGAVTLLHNQMQLAKLKARNNNTERCPLPQAFSALEPRVNPAHSSPFADISNLCRRKTAPDL